VIPKDSGYKPPREKWPNLVSFDHENMRIITHIMIAAGVVDREVRESKDKRKCKPGMVPVYKFLLNEGYVVTANEAQLIADSLGRQDLVANDFLKKLMPKLERFDKALKDYVRELMDVWIPFNRVAAANKGYTVK
jgi:hypothetical protein